VLQSSDRGGIRVQFSKNPFGRKRDAYGNQLEQPPPQQQQQQLGARAGHLQAAWHLQAAQAARLLCASAAASCDARRR
jgi:hypothetical protein